MRFLAAATAALVLAECYSVPGGIAADEIVAGRITSVQDSEWFIGDVAMQGYVYKLRPNAEPGTEIEFISTFTTCPANPPGDRDYLVFLDRGGETWDAGSPPTRPRKVLTAVACTPVDQDTSVGLIKKRHAS
ncbi:MAG: hypothetical protein JOZ72_14085 [Alphaproteobacteria bacterium]|nr:hypothetical protein [Alphaproteobacteria bacterium]